MAMNIALVGIGKIAVDQHVPSIQGSSSWRLAATVSRRGTVAGAKRYPDIETMLAARLDIPVVSLCLPPAPRFAAASAALEAGRHVMLEKPPGATLAECGSLGSLARKHELTVFATWHSREAAAVGAARDWIEGKCVRRVHVVWREDVRKWHPGQDWIFEPGGMGVLDPGINALSILTEILPQPVHLRGARLRFPENRQTPIAADLEFSGNVTAEFDWRERGREVWTINVETDAGSLLLTEGGGRMFVDGVETQLSSGPSAGAPSGEYSRLYARMAELVAVRAVEMDLRPMIHVADAFLIGRRLTVGPFDW